MIHRWLLWLVLSCTGPWCGSAVAATRIVSLAPNLTEIAFAVGAGERIVGTVEYSDHPQAARAVPRVGDAFQVDYERVLALRPDLILAWEPGTSPAIVERLRALGLEVTSIPTRNLADVGQAMRTIGRVAGVEQQAASVADRFDGEIAQLRREYGGRRSVAVYLQVNDRPLYTVNGTQIMSEVIALCGGRNVFAALSDLAPQISVEAVIAANPEVIITTGELQSEALEQWRRWRHLRAVRADNLYRLEPDDLARSTPRLAHGAQSMCRTLETARQRLAASP